MKTTIYSFLKLIFVGLLFIIPTISFSNIIILNGLTHENTASSGSSYKGTIQLQNTANTVKSVRVYQKDYWFSYKGETLHGEPGSLKRSNSKWITYNPEFVELQPDETRTIDFEVKIPADDSLRGTYWSVLMIENIVPPDTSNYNSGVTIKTSIRYAIQIITNIGNTGNSNLQFNGLNLAKNENNSYISVALENTGETILKPVLSLELFDQNGNSVGVIKSEKRKTFPETSVTIVLNLEGIKPGTYNGVLIADCENDNVFGTNISFELI